MRAINHSFWPHGRDLKAALKIMTYPPSTTNATIAGAISLGVQSRSLSNSFEVRVPIMKPGVRSSNELYRRDDSMVEHQDNSPIDSIKVAITILDALSIHNSSKELVCSGNIGCLLQLQCYIQKCVMWTDPYRDSTESPVFRYILALERVVSLIYCD